MRTRQEFGLMRRRLPSGMSVYYYWIYDESNRRIYRSTGQRTKALALDYVLKRRDAGMLGRKDRSMTVLSDFAGDFFISGRCPIERNAHMRGRSMTLATCAVRRKALTAHILPHLGSLPVSGITRARVNQWLMDLPAKDGINRSTANTVLVTLRLVMAQAVREGLLPFNPCDNVENLGSDSVRRASFTTEEVRRIIGRKEDWDDPRVRLMCLTASVTGMRIGEIRALRTDCITGTAIHVRASYSDLDGYKTPKNGRDRVAPVPAGLRMELRNTAPGKGGYVFSVSGDEPLPYPNIRRALIRRLKALGISGRTFHSFRAFFNTEMMAANVNETVVRAVVGHQSAEMTEHYLHLETGNFSQIRKVQNNLMQQILA